MRGFYGIRCLFDIVGLGMTFVMESGANPDQANIGRCGFTYTQPKALLWMLSVAKGCEDGVSCSYTIEAPEGSIVKMNLTSRSGLSDFADINSSSAYDLIDGESSCRPRIEMSENYEEAGDVQVTRRRTLCYDRLLYGSSVIIQTKANIVRLSIYCVPQRYSFFSMNFTFVPQLETCNSSLECHGQCIEAVQVCDGVKDCSSGEDEMNCDVRDDSFSIGHSQPIKHQGDAFTEDSGLVLVVILLAVVFVAFFVATFICLCRRRSLRGHVARQRLSAQSDITALTTSCWKDGNDDNSDGGMRASSPMGAGLPTQQLLQVTLSEGTNRPLLQRDNPELQNSMATTSAQDHHRRQQAELQERLPARVIRSSDGEAPYWQQRKQLKTLNERMYKNDYGRPPNRTVPTNLDSIAEYPVQKQWSGTGNSSSSKNSNGAWSPPPYSHNNIDITAPPPYDTVVSGATGGGDKDSAKLSVHDKCPNYQQAL